MSGTERGANGEPRVEPIDLLLRQGSAEELQDFRDRVTEDPLLALDLADTVTLIERLRSVRVEPDPEFAGKLAGVVRRAERRLQPPHRGATPWLLAAAVAVVGFLAASWADPLALRRQPARAVAEVLPEPPRRPAVAVVDIPTRAELEHRDTLGAMRRRFELESATELSAALEAAVQAERDTRANELQSWLDPRNALAVLHLDHELRGHAEVRRRALQSGGAMPVADERAQGLADAIARELGEVDLENLPHAELALALRAIVAAGASTQARRSALGAGTALLARRMPQLHGETRAQALAALVETAAVEGLPIRGIAAAGRELVDEVMRADDDTWLRRRPFLLTSRVASATLGDAGRTLALLPAFGVATDRCAFVRQLVLGQLRERRENDREDRPEVLAAMLYGFADLLSDRERNGLVRELRRWKPARLAPDFTTVQQIAWAVEPGWLGFARLQRDLRRLVILPDPERLGQRAALCMCLATSYAAHRAESLERFVLGE